MLERVWRLRDSAVYVVALACMYAYSLCGHVDVAAPEGVR